MPMHLVAMSHSPLLDKVDVPELVRAELEVVFESLRKVVSAFAPDVVVLFTPDHYNGFFYDIMPPFCIGTAAEAIGDFESAAGSLNVPDDLAEELARFVLSRDVDVALSRAMHVDHGAVQPLEILFGGIESIPVIPVFVNGVAEPFAPMTRVGTLGRAIGEFFADRPERVLVLASGGLSHDPPVPQWATAPSPLRKAILDGRNRTPAARAEREARVFATARDFAQGTATIQDLNPSWDREFMSLCRSGRLEELESYSSEQMTSDAGHSSHEVRTWVAAFAAQASISPYEIGIEFYKPIREYIAGFGVMTATSSSR
ncbi:3-carboxyethylcatechol 2,3-dioxygenase [Rhodococcus artemisiae]|uniref:2,3-dihydroxyphenylpropionate/2,3-dihydroxicinnamic acid 1,2-dioxygenase n=1 Tax=Rhodococcus artemisiae TaxID=714159 RepID=A0ABU7LFU5_9NOCA|nr:3-carboxyethylcatechol 2,3-dioxygenase [Rhodococcus artemisiae]MEE2060421.1 3-carboxyethylcatechol 2,3-dioxygenase [Rhodococcus artemisiae]